MCLKKLFKDVSDFVSLISSGGLLQSLRGTDSKQSGHRLIYSKP